MSNSIEILTEDERACMDGTTLRRKALRIINAQATRIAKLEERLRCATVICKMEYFFNKHESLGVVLNALQDD